MANYRIEGGTIKKEGSWLTKIILFIVFVAAMVHLWRWMVIAFIVYIVLITILSAVKGGNTDG